MNRQAQRGEATPRTTRMPPASAGGSAGNQQRRGRTKRSSFFALALAIVAACEPYVEDQLAPQEDVAVQQAPLVTCSRSREGRPCDDLDPCTFGDRCERRICAGTAYSCDDRNVCTSDACDGRGACAHVANTAPCDDANACTVNDVCAYGTCGGAARSCDDGNACTADACDAVGGCVHVATSAPCDDGNACTVNDSCTSGACIGTVPVEACGNALDDDCDGQVDEGCLRACAQEDCFNGLDDDCDAFVDAADADCDGPDCTIESCNNEIDDDCDTLVDFADPDCYCWSGACGADMCPPGYVCNEISCCMPHCGDGSRNGDESDIDCGGYCASDLGMTCAPGHACWGNWECQSGVCLNAVCQ